MFDNAQSVTKYPETCFVPEKDLVDIFTFSKAERFTHEKKVKTK
jgi:hypothetical protein